ncbi:MAG TPA: WD40 repeat domain-containing protein [Aliidongia sp.]|nr:WD40 repeat domain-containing protein [Aliidongia sp.]
MTLFEQGPPTALSPSREIAFDATIAGARFLSDDLLALGLGDGSVRLVPPDPACSTVSVQAHEAGGAVLSLAADIDANAVLTGGDDGQLVRTGRDGSSRVLTAFPGRQIDALAVSAAGSLRAVAAGRVLRLIDRADRIIGTSDDHPSTITGLAFNPKGKRIASSHYGGVTLRWIGKLDQGATRLDWHGSHIGVTWSPDGSAVLSSMQDSELHGWRLADRSDMRMSGYISKVRSMGWLPRPMTLVTAGADCAIGWVFAGSGPQGKPPIEIGVGIGRLTTAVAVHPLHPIVAVGFEDGRAVLCELAGERYARLRPADDKRIEELAWSKDGKHLAAATEDGRLALFRMPFDARL